jgi:hypothetical protein
VVAPINAQRRLAHARHVDFGASSADVACPSLLEVKPAQERVCDGDIRTMTVTCDRCSERPRGTPMPLSRWLEAREPVIFHAENRQGPLPPRHGTFLETGRVNTKQGAQRELPAVAWRGR